MRASDEAARLKEIRAIVTFRGLRSGRTHQVVFDCGEHNPETILREAWNTRSEIMSVAECAALSAGAGEEGK